MLAIAVEHPFPGLVTIPVGLFAFFITEYRRTFHLAALPASVAGIVFILPTAADMFSHDLQVRLLAGAHLLVYLSWIVFFMKKQVSQYWWICALSVLQVAVGAVLNDTGLFGALLLIYLYFSIWTLAVFSLYQARLQLTDNANEAVINEIPEQYGHKSQSQPQLALATSSLAASPFSTYSLRGKSTVSSALHSDDSQFSLGIRFLFGIAMITGLSLIVSACFFLGIPRLWPGAPTTVAERMGGSKTPAVAMAGFTEKVQLGDIGINLSSSKPVLEVRTFRDRDDQPIDVETFARQLGHDEPLFRGVALTKYKNGTWEIGNREYEGLPVPTQIYPGSIRQEIRLQPIGTDAFFTLQPVDRVVTTDVNVELQMSVSSVIRRADGKKNDKPISYSIYSYRQRPNKIGRAYLKAITRGRNGNLYSQIEWSNKRLPANELNRLKQFVDDLIDKEKAKLNVETLSPTAIALLLERHLGESGLFEYSLTTSTIDDNLDPIEDFLVNRKSGHCEYYASALTLMLRHAGIPARLISGFKGGQLNKISGAYEVEQRHAHAWVEALLDGEWVVFDPTPADKRSESVESMTPKMQTWQDMKRVLTSYWSSNVIHLGFGKQQQRIFRPLMAAGKSALSSAGSYFNYLRTFLTSPKRWFSQQGLAIWTSIICTIALIVWLSKKLRRWKGWNWVRSAKSKRRLDRRVEFYERFQKLCQASGLVRNESQTQQEFAAHVDQSWEAILKPAQLSGLPSRLTTDFYQVRFGNQSLPDQEATWLDGQLTILEKALKSQNRK